MGGFRNPVYTDPSHAYSIHNYKVNYYSHNYILYLNTPIFLKITDLVQTIRQLQIIDANILLSMCSLKNHSQLQNIDLLMRAHKYAGWPIELSKNYLSCLPDEKVSTIVNTKERQKCA